MDVCAAKPPELVAALERMKRLANGLADLGDQLNSQATRIFGSSTAEPSGPIASIGTARGEGAPLLFQIHDVFETIERNMARVRVGVDRLSDLA